VNNPQHGNFTPSNGQKPLTCTNQQSPAYLRQQPSYRSPYIQKIEHEVSPIFIIIEVILLLAAIATMIFFCSFLSVDIHYDYVHAAVPVIAETDTALVSSASVAEPKEDTKTEQPTVAYTIDDLTLYDWTKPVPESKTYPLDWFEDTAFIGDSRTAGLLMYTKLKAINLSATNLTVATMMSKKYLRIRDENDEYVNMNALDALKYYDGQYKAIYISLGLNELGGNINAIITNYKDAIAAIRKITSVPLYIQLVMPVTTAFAENSQYGITNERAYELNDKLTALAESERFFLLDPLSLVVLEDGTLDPEKSFDGAHLTPKSYQTLVEYLQCHVVEYSDYVEK